MEAKSIEVEVKDVVLGLIGKVFDIEEEKIDLEEELAYSLGADSTEMVELLVLINTHLGTNLKPAEINTFQTPRQIVRIIESRV